VLTMGFDPEIGLTTGKRDQLLPAWLFTKGTKDNPEPLPGYKGDKNIGILFDGVALEVNAAPVEVNAPMDIAEHWDLVWHNVRKYLITPKKIGAFNETIGMFSDAAVLSDKRATLYGCSEDYDAYSEFPEKERGFVPPQDGIKCFGGHIHFGYDTKLCPPHIFVKLLSLLGLPYLDGRQHHRRLRFGLPGLFRPKKYGVEYRTPGNSWAFSSGLLAGWGACALVLINILEKNPKPLIKVHRTLDWETFGGSIRVENFKAARKLSDSVWKALYDESPQMIKKCSEYVVPGLRLGSPEEIIPPRDPRLAPDEYRRILEEDLPDIDEDNA
jgi:hypothetical protein